MKIKRFLASSMREAMRRVREEQGPDAVILASHTREDGIEVVAAVDYDEALMRQAVQRGETEPAVPSPRRIAAGRADTPVEWAVDPQIRRLESELAQLRGLLEATLEANETQLAKAHPNRARIYRLMETLGFSPRVARRTAASLPVDADEQRTRVLPVGWLARHLQVSPPTVLEQGGRIALVGPTGVGKTTTLAKLAERAVRRFGARQVAVASLDTYRIGAEEQLSTYARLLGVPLFIVPSPDQLSARLAELADCRCVFIDTPGMSPADTRLAEALEVLGAMPEVLSTWLVLSAGQQREDLEAAVSRFAPVRPQALVLTKVDECTRLGGALSVALERQLPITVISDGQRVPEDLHTARAADLVLRAMQNARQVLPPSETPSVADLETEIPTMERAAHA